MDATVVRPQAASETRFAALVTASYVVVAGAAALVHEPWRDETHAWLVARDATSVVGLFRNLRYEGHPALWHVCLWPLTRLGGPELMQPLAVAMGAAAIFVFARFAPFPRSVRALFAFGYLQVWEWGAIARNYGMGVLLLFAAAALTVRRERHPVLLGAVLALAASTSAVAALAAGGIVALLVRERLAPWSDPARSAPALPFWSGALLGAAGIAACAAQVIPPSDSAIAGVWGAQTLADRAGKALAAPLHGLAPIPWPESLESMAWLRGLQIACAGAAAAALVATAALVLRRRHGAWIAAAAPAAALLSLFFFRYYGGARHAGYLFVALLVALWVAPSYPLRRAARDGRDLGARAEARLPAVLAAALAFQVTGTVVQGVVDGVGVYSAGRATAELVREAGLASLPIVGDPDFLASHVVAWLGARSAWYVNVGREGSFDVWDGRHADRSRTFGAPDAEVFAAAAARARASDVVVIVSREASPDAVAAAGAWLVGARRADVRVEESYWVYVVPRR